MCCKLLLISFNATIPTVSNNNWIFLFQTLSSQLHSFLLMVSQIHFSYPIHMPESNETSTNSDVPLLIG